jgi:hypothetical protein
LARRRRLAAGNDAGPTGNFIAEWFGYRVWPAADTSIAARHDQPARICPFLTSAKRETTACIKWNRDYDEPTGVCTISSESNGVREDWLACPFRILDQHFTLLGGAIRTLYRIPTRQEIVLFPVTVLSNPDRKREVHEALSQGTRVFAFSGSKLGGEVDVPETNDSPGAKVDNSVIEITGIDPATGKPSQYGKHLFVEIQTADFHGSPLHAVRLLREKCQAGTDTPYHDAITAAPQDCGQKVEGPNKSNIFKRTIYQMILKIELTNHEESAGFAIVLPVPVWQSWLRHLGQPSLVADPVHAGVQHLHLPGYEIPAGEIEHPRSWIFVFDIDRDSPESPAPLKILYRIAISSEALSTYAFKESPRKAIEHGAIDDFRRVLINERVIKGWEGKPLPEDTTSPNEESSPAKPIILP